MAILGACQTARTSAVSFLSCEFSRLLQSWRQGQEQLKDTIKLTVFTEFHPFFFSKKIPQSITSLCVSKILKKLILFILANFLVIEERIFSSSYSLISTDTTSS